MDPMTRHLKDLADLVEQRGWALQAVLSPLYPASVDFTYTVGNTAVGLPELLVLGLRPEIAGGLLNDLNALVRDGALIPEPGAVVPGQLAGYEPAVSFRFGEVAERWAVHYGVMAYNLHLGAGGHPHDIRFLQVIVPDPDGRHWDDPDYLHHFTDVLQPDLSDPSRPWRIPYIPPIDLVQEPPGDAVVLVPVIEPHGDDLGRREAVPATSLGDDVYRLDRPPVLADWVTVDTEVRAPEAEPVDLPGIPVGQVYEQVVRPSPLVHLVWVMHVHGMLDYHALMDRVEPEFDLPGTTWLDSWDSLHVATPQRFAERLRSRMRHLVRDGLLIEREPFHRPADPDTSCGPWCNGYQGP